MYYKFKPEFCGHEVVGSQIVINGCLYIKSLKGIEHLNGNLKGLKLINCYRLTDISSIAFVDSITNLVIKNCTRLVFTDALRYLVRVNSFSIDNYNMLIPATVGAENNYALLTYVSLRNCNALKSTVEFGRFLSLVELRINSCLNLVSLRGIEMLKNLRILRVSYCNNLTNLNGIYQLTLTILSICYCNRIASLDPVAWPRPMLDPVAWPRTMATAQGPALLSKMPRPAVATPLGPAKLLTSLILYSVGLQNLSGLEHFTELTHLSLRYCTNLASLNELQYFHKLIDLDLTDCVTLRSIEIIVKLRNLEFLRLQNCTNLKFIPENIICLKNLKEMCIKGCCNLSPKLLFASCDNDNDKDKIFQVLTSVVKNDASLWILPQA